MIAWLYVECIHQAHVCLGRIPPYTLAMMLSRSSPPYSVRAHTHHSSLRISENILSCVYSRAPRVSPMWGSTQARQRCLRQIAQGSKSDLEDELDATQKAVDRAMQLIAAAQPTPSSAQDATYLARDEQLWERQLSLLDRVQQHWEQERQVWLNKESVWHERESNLLRELASLRSELQAILTLQAAAAAAVPGSATAANYPAAAAASSSSSRPGASDLPGIAVISGPSPASAAVADAIRAVRDAHVNPPSTSSSSSVVGSSGAGIDSWQELFPNSMSSSSSSSSNALDSFTAATADVDDDVLADMDLRYSSSSGSRRGRRQVDLASGSSSSSSSSNGNGASMSSSSPPAQAPSSSSSSVTSVETVKGEPSGPPPLLAVDDDDIYWVSKLHDALMSAGFYPSDDEIENWLFAEGTQSALITFQACNGVPETGTTCEASWRKLLGDEHYEAICSSSSSSATAAPDSSADAVIVQEEETVTFSFSSSSSSDSSGKTAAWASSSSSSSSQGWPVLMDMDGGREVHALQVALGKAGYSCGDDEMRWWQFGSATLDALKTFQACNGLPESGVCDERTWQVLLGPDATPEDVEAVRGDESIYEDDMSAPHEGAVWLLGEQRWSRPVRANDN